MEEKSQWPRILVAIVLFAVAGTYGYSKYAKLRPGPEINNGVTGDFERPTAAQREERREEWSKEIGITPEQQKQMDEIREKADGDWRQMREGMEKVLTEDQRAKIRSGFEARRAQRDQQMRASMSGADFEAYQKRREEMRQRWQQNGGGGGRRGGGRAGDGGGGSRGPSQSQSS